METESKPLPELTKALVKAQAAMEPAVKDRTNPAFKSKYADMSSIVDAVRKPLADNGLAFVQFVSSDAEGLSVVTRLLHVSGESLESPPCWMPVVQKTPQGYGSAATYAKRYALAALLGVATEDDDGHDASRKPPKPEPKKPIDTSKLVTAFAGLGVPQAHLEDRIGKPLAEATEADVEALRAFHKQKKELASETADQKAARLEAEKAEAGILAEQEAKSKPERFATFEAIVDRIRAATDSKAVILIEAEAAQLKVLTDGDRKALARTAGDRRLVLDDAAKQAKRKLTIEDRSQDLPQ